MLLLQYWGKSHILYSMGGVVRARPDSKILLQILQLCRQLTALPGGDCGPGRCVEEVHLISHSLEQAVPVSLGGEVGGQSQIVGLQQIHNKFDVFQSIRTEDFFSFSSTS